MFLFISCFFLVIISEQCGKVIGLVGFTRVWIRDYFRTWFVVILLRQKYNVQGFLKNSSSLCNPSPHHGTKRPQENTFEKPTLKSNLEKRVNAFPAIVRGRKWLFRKRKKGNGIKSIHLSFPSLLLSRSLPLSISPDNEIQRWKANSLKSHQLTVASYLSSHSSLALAIVSLYFTLILVRWISYFDHPSRNQSV